MERDCLRDALAKLTESYDEKTRQDIALGKRIGTYQLKQQIGLGNFGKVKLGIHLLTNEKVAVKIIDKAKLDAEARKMRVLTNEVASLSQLYHPHIVRLFEVIDSFLHLHLVMEYIPGGSVHCRVAEEGAFNEKFAQAIFLQIVSGVKYMHSTGIAHRDLKAENILFLTNDSIKIADFGFSSTCTSEEYFENFCGSPSYIAPEMYQEKRYRGHPADMWAVGVILYYMVTGSVPFEAGTLAQLQAMITAADYPPPSCVTCECSDLIGRLLTCHPDDRMTVHNLPTCQWIKNTTLAESYCANTDSEILIKMENLGIPVTDSDKITGEPRSPLAGIYRILLHKKVVSTPLRTGEVPEDATKISSTRTTTRYCCTL